jgi:predicted double-glycine peptidase
MEAFNVPKSHIKVKLPSTRQPKCYSCGASALRAIAVYFKVGPNNEQFYMDKCKTNKEGTPPENIIRTALELGLSVSTKQYMTIRELRQYLDKGIPVICLIQAWGDEEYYKTHDYDGHYVVAIGYTDDKIYFMDPSIKGSHGFLKNAEFMARWHDEETDGTKTVQCGIAIWKPTKDKKKQDLRKVQKIQ